MKDSEHGHDNYAISPAVAGVSVAPASGLVTWDFSTTGTFYVFVLATDALGAQRTTGYVVSVANANPFIHPNRQRSKLVQPASIVY
jgi:hypothetical protein